MLSETVDPGSGSVSVHIQAPTAKGRGITLPFSFAYSSNGVEHLNPGVGGISWLSNSSVLSQGGWSFLLPTISSNLSVTNTVNGQGETVTCYFVSYYVFRDPAGGLHNLSGMGSASYQQVNGGYNSTPCGTPVLDGGDARQTGALQTTQDLQNTNPGVTVSDTDGTIYNFTGSGSGSGQLPSFIEDRNGNTIAAGNNNPVYYYDTAGRPAIELTGFGPSGATNTVTISGEQYQVTWTSTSASYSVPNHLAINTQQGQICYAWGPISATETVISSITLPNGGKYNFYYNNPYGLLSEIDYPDGGWVRYTYTLSTTSYNEPASYTSNGVNGGSPQAGGCQFQYSKPVIASRTVGFIPGVTALTQNFTYGTTWSTASNYIHWTQKNTSVTTQDNILGESALTAYTYSPGASYNASPYNFPISVAADIPLEQTIQYYNWGNTSSPVRAVSKSWFDIFDISGEQTILSDENNLTSQVTYSYQSLGTLTRLTQKNEYDYGLGLLRQTNTNYQAFQGTPLGGTIADKPCQVITYDGNNNRYAETDYFYDGGTTLCTAGTRSVTGVSGLATGTHDESNYGSSSTAPRGNLTQKTQWANAGSSPVTTYTYDETGQVLSKTDPCGNTTCSDMSGSTHTTNYSYTDSYTVLSGGSNASFSPTDGKTNAYLTTITDALSHTENFTYDYYSGQLTVSTDENSQSTKYLYNDLLSRPTLVNYPDGGSTSIAYNDSTYNATAHSPSVTTTKAISSSLAMVNMVAFDGVGHEVWTNLSSDPEGPVYTQTSYAGTGKTYQAYNPYRSTTDSTYGITTFTYDALGRNTQVAEPDGSNVSTTYLGNLTTTADEAGNQRENKTDGLGRLAAVLEAPNQSSYNYLTSYGYDPLNDLVSVAQNGSSSAKARNRSFTYDSLSRLVCAGNPEVQIVTCPSSATGTFPTGALLYSYDTNGNLATKTAPSPNQPSTGIYTVATSYTYDALNRITGKSYNDSYANNQATPAVTFGYDGSSLNTCPTPMGYAGTGATNGIGRRTAMCFSSGSKSWQLDPMGRIISENDRFIGLVPPYGPSVHTNIGAGVPTISTDNAYEYYLNGDLLDTYYPQPGIPGYEFSTEESAAGRVVSAGDEEGWNLWAATYTPDGQLATGMIDWTSGRYQTFSNTYNKRLQPVLISDTAPSGAAILNLTYNFNLGNGTTGSDNGNVIGVTNANDGIGAVNYTYDPLNRISSAYTTSSSWGENYTTDAWGNLTNIALYPGKSNSETLNCAPANTQNQLNTCYAYDAAGSLIKNGTTTYTYDAENRLIATGGFSYVYDGDGQRIEKCTAGATPGSCAGNATGTFYWRFLDGNPQAESDLGGNWTASYGVIRGQITSRVDLPSNVPHYYFQDRLHSTNAITDANGHIEQVSDYYPYGGEIVITAGDSNHYKFTSKERDAESGLDYFGARHYASSMGRFMTPDWADDPTPVPFADLSDPQSLSLYSYAGNNPSTVIDPDGHCGDSAFAIACAGGEGPYDIYTEEQKPCEGDACVTPPVPQKPLPQDPKCKYSACVTAPPPEEAHTTYFPNTWEFPAVGRILGGVVRAASVPVIVLGYLVSPPYKYAKDTIDPEPNDAASDKDKKEHTKGARKSTWGKHSKPRPGRATTKDRLKPGFKPRTPPRPQDM